MRAEYKVNLVKELPHQNKPSSRRPRIGGFGLQEDDLIYQMVLDNLEEGDHPYRKEHSPRQHRDE